MQTIDCGNQPLYLPARVKGFPNRYLRDRSSRLGCIPPLGPVAISAKFLARILDESTWPGGYARAADG